jgi:hypothetical protein
MIDFGLCRKCPHGKFQPAKIQDGETKVRASVKCGLDDADVLFMNSDPPKDCPFALEHKLATQDVPIAFANHMSGCRRSRETEF